MKDLVPNYLCKRFIPFRLGIILRVLRSCYHVKQVCFTLFPFKRSHTLESFRPRTEMLIFLNFRS